MLAAVLIGVYTVMLLAVYGAAFLNVAANALRIKPDEPPTLHAIHAGRVDPAGVADIPSLPFHSCK